MGRKVKSRLSEEKLQSSIEVYRLSQAFGKMSDEILRSYEAQKNFSANAAHELRTPLAVLQTKLDVFSMKGEHTQQEYDGLLCTVNDYTDRLSQIVSDLLALTSKKPMDMAQRIFLKDMLEEMLYDLERLAAPHHISLHLTGENVVTVENDSLLQQVFYNILTNAIKYNKENGTVLVSVKESGSHAVVTVSDSGIRIPEDSKPHLFDPFYRVDPSRNREIGGSGFGLALVNDIVEKHHGTITVKDNQPAGSIFEVTLEVYHEL